MKINATLPFDIKAAPFRGVTVISADDSFVDSTFLMCTDGQGVGYFNDCLAQQFTNERIVLIGVHNCPTNRALEYVEGRDDTQFLRHERFFTHAVRDWVHAEFNVELNHTNTAAFGYSCGGAFAVSMGIRHPSLFGSIIALSVAGRPVPVHKTPPASLNLSERHFYLAAGDREFGGMKRYMERLAEWIQKSGGRSEFRTSAGGHDIQVWQRELSRGIEWLSGRDESPERILP